VPSAPTPLAGVDPGSASLPHCLSNNHRLLAATMSESYKELEKRISDACDAYSARRNPKIKPLSREFDVPYKRLLRRIKGRDSRSTRVNPNKILYEAQEHALIYWIISLDNANTSPTSAMIERCANQILHQNRRSQVVSKSWVYRFIKRLPPHLKLRPIQQRPKESKRVQAEDIVVIQYYYERLNDLIIRHNIHPKNIYNFDECGFIVGEGKKQKVVSANPSTNTFIPTGDRGQSLTAIEYIAADGWVMSPFFLLPGQCYMENWYRQASLPDDYRIGVTPNGYTSDAMAYDWLHFFHTHTRSRISSREYRLLLMDGHESHKTYEFIQFCEKHHIIPYFFPPHLTHLLQPLDGKPFLAYKHHYRMENNEVVLWAGSFKEKKDFLREIDSVRRRTFTPRTIRSGFADKGIYPVDSHMVTQPLEEASL
jgi:hypothetical protein